MRHYLIPATVFTMSDVQYIMFYYELLEHYVLSFEIKYMYMTLNNSSYATNAEINKLIYENGVTFSVVNLLLLQEYIDKY